MESVKALLETRRNSSFMTKGGKVKKKKNMFQIFVSNCKDVYEFVGEHGQNLPWHRKTVSSDGVERYDDEHRTFLLFKFQF